MNHLVDSHCHLDLFQSIQSNPHAENALGIKTISVTNAPSFYQPNCKLFAGLENIRVALGLHPQLVEKYAPEAALFEQYIDSTKYIGEIGLDGSKELQNFYPNQLKTFERILGMVGPKGDKILTVHSRNAATETIQVLSKNLSKSSARVILHWFSGNKAELQEGIKNRFYFSINHKMVGTEKGKELIKYIPDQLLLTETDAPFTFSAIIKNRDQSIKYTLKAIAAIKGKGVQEYQHQVFENFKRMITF